MFGLIISKDSLIFIFLFSCHFTQAQSYREGFVNDVPNEHLLIERLLENKKFLKANPQYRKSNDIVYVPIKMHLVAQTDGSGRISHEMAIRELCYLNEQYEDVGVIFYLKDSFNEYNHSDSYEFENFNLASARMNFEKDDDALNIFITKNAQASSNQGGFVFGVYYHAPYDFIVIRKDQIGIDDIVLPHEIGHYFSLAHPYRGWENNPWNEEDYGKQVTTTRIFSSGSGWVNVELVDRSNCDNAGDLICDTAVDYFFSFIWDDDCRPFNLNVTDLNGDTIMPPMENFMSNFFGCNHYEFSEDQKAILRADYFSSRRSMLRTSYIPDTNKISDELNILTPGFNETVAKFNSVDFEWEAVEHAESYLVEINGAGETNSFITVETAFTLTNLQPNSVYTWSILPFNETGGCAEKEGSIFRTSDSSTPVQDPEFINEILVYPNPLQSDQQLKLEFASDRSLPATIKIYNSTGQLILGEYYQIIAGSNKLQYSMDKGSNGLFTIIIDTDSGSLIRRFVML